MVSSAVLSATREGARSRPGLWCARGLRLIALAASLSSSCSVLVEQDRVQCSVDADCADRGLAGAVCVDSICQPEPKWGCLGSVTWPPPMANKFNVTVRVRELIT